MTRIPATKGKNLVELLDMLEPVPAPDRISMWPATQAWIWLGLIVAAAVIWGAWRLYLRWKSNAYRRAALAELAQAGDDPAMIAAILRRVALVAYPRKQVAGLVGQEWLRFLDRTSATGTAARGFSSDVGALLIKAPYRKEPANPDLSRLARDWVKSHQTEAPV